MSKNTNHQVYILESIENFGDGVIHPIKITCNVKEAKKWLENQPKTNAWSHGYRKVNMID